MNRHDAQSVAPPLPARNQRGAGSGGPVGPAAVLPVQFFSTLQRQGPHRTGEYRLLVAVLEDAIHCFKRYALPRSARELRLFAEAERWIMDEDDPHVADSSEPALFSFEYVCGVVGLDPAGVRQSLQRWRAARLHTRVHPQIRLVPSSKHHSAASAQQRTP